MSNTQTANRKKKKKKTRQLHRGVLPGILGREVAARFSTPVFRPYGLSLYKVHISFQTWRRSQNATYMFTKTEIISSLVR